MNQATQVAQWSQQYGSGGPLPPPEWEKAKKALEEMQQTSTSKAKSQSQQKKAKASEAMEASSPPALAEAPPPPPPPPLPQQHYPGYNQGPGYYGQPGSYNMGGPGGYGPPGPQYPPHYGGYNGYGGMPNGPRGLPAPGPYGPGGPGPGGPGPGSHGHGGPGGPGPGGPGPGPMYRHGPGHGPAPGPYGSPGGMYGTGGPHQGYGSMPPRGVPPPPLHGQPEVDNAEDAGDDAEKHPVIGPQPRPAYNMYGSQQNYKNKNQAPGSGGIRFNLPKRNNVQQGNAFQNYANNNHYMYKPPQQEQPLAPQQKMPQTPTKDVSSSPTTAAAGEEWPPALKNYVSRAFAAAGSDKVAKDEVEKELKEKITTVFNAGRAGVINWKTEPLPLAVTKKVTMDAMQHSRIQQSMLQHANMIGAYRKSQQQQQSERPSRWEQAITHTLHPPHTPQRPSHHTAGPAINRRPRSPAGFRRRSRSSSRSRSLSRSRSRSRSRSPPSYRRRRRRYSNSSSDSLSDLSSGSSHRGYSSVRGKGGRGRGRGADSTERTKSWRQNTPKKDQENNNFQRKNNEKRKQGKKMFYNEAVDCHKLQKRAARFAGDFGTKKQRTKPLTLQINSLKSNTSEDELDWSQFTIVGTCNEMVKGYLRLTSAPDASTVRPVPVLRRSLTMVKERWQAKHDYHYVCEQLKSIRQDLTVQAIRNEFCVHVYETHARIAMENGDHEEFNQCQTNLKLLYTEGIKGHETEFLAYRILYYIFTKNDMDMNTALMSLRAEHRKDECIKHAVQVRSAWGLQDFNRFFRLYKQAPKMSGYLLDWFIERERTSAMKQIIKAYRPSIPVEFCQRQLAYDNLKECVKFLRGIGATLSADELRVDCKVGLSVVEAQ